MENDQHKRIKTVLLAVIGVLLFILGIVIGLLLAGAMSDRPLGSTDGNTVQSLTESAQSQGGDAAGADESGQSDADTESDSGSEDGVATNAQGNGMAESDSETEEPQEAIRIVLDPGHDDTCSRNHPDLGVNEQDLNLKIALACRDELNTYKGVEVFMTREDGSCPDNGIGSDDVTGRTAYAESVDADLFVSIHNNATGLGYPSDANGTEVYISVHSAFTDESRKLGESILTELTSAVDLADRGVLTRIKPEKGYYEDGNVKDWYYLISTSVERGFPGIIIEHAFMDNPHDNELLKNDENLKAMGIADAAGIAKYYGLEKK